MANGSPKAGRLTREARFRDGRTRTGEHPVLGTSFSQGKGHAPRGQGVDQTPEGLMQQGCQTLPMAPDPAGRRNKAFQPAVSPAVLRVLTQTAEGLQDFESRNRFSTHEKRFVLSGQMAVPPRQRGGSGPMGTSRAERPESETEMASWRRCAAGLEARCEAGAGPR